MKYSQKYCLVQPLDSIRLGDEFAASDWPLHITIVGVFAIDWNDKYFSEFANLIASYRAFSSKTTSIEYFGLKQEIKVRLVKPNENLQMLHTDIAKFVLGHGGSFNDLHYQFDGFRPHATMRGDQPDENCEITFDTLALIDMFPDGNHTRRKIIKFFELSQN